MGDDVSDERLEKQVERSAADSVTGPLLVPMNLDADLNLSSKVVLYEGLTLHDFRGVAMMHEGAIKLTELGLHDRCGTSQSQRPLFSSYKGRDDIRYGACVEQFLY